jgi:hypothetical protein
VCRPSKSLWALVVMFILFGLGMSVIASIQRSQEPVRSTDDFWLLVVIIGLMSVLPALGTAWSLIRCRLILDDRGLTFHRFFTTQFVPWQKVEDYELRLNSKQYNTKSKYPAGYVRVSGKWISLGLNNGDIDNYEARRQRVEAHAKWSRARSWQLQEVREDGDWPKTFEYQDSSGWKLVALGVLAPLLLCGLLGLSTWLNTAQTGRTPDLYAFASVVFQFFSYCSLMSFSQYPTLLARRRYLGQKIVVTLQGISLWKDGHETALLWDEVESYYLQSMPGIMQPSRAIVEGQRVRIGFLTRSPWTHTLKLIVQNRARNAKTLEWAYQHGTDPEVLGGAASFWKGTEVGVGPKIYHCRTRSIRAMLLFGSVVVLAVGAVTVAAYMGILGDSPRGISPGDLVLLGPLSLGLLFGFLEYRYTKAWCEEDGLTTVSWRGKRFLSWNEVESIGKGGLGYVVKGRSTSLRIWVSMADIEGLKAEIEARTGLTWNEK